MIFRKSLSKKKGAAYSFFSGLSSGFVPAVIILLVQTFLMAVMPLIEFISTDFYDSDTVNKILSKDKYKFFVFAMNDTSTLYIVFAILGILAILVAVRLFSFICDKKTVNVYYSLGIKRSTLFITKYLAGAALLIGAILIPTVITYIINLFFLGGSWQLSLVMLHMYCGFSVFLLICFSVAAVVFSSVGTVSEAIVYSAGLLFAPTLIIYITELFIDAFLPSSTLQMYVLSFNHTMHQSFASSNSLLTDTQEFNPLLFFVNEVMTFSTGYLKNGELSIIINDEKAPWIFPNLFIHLPWFIIAIALGLFGALLFKRLKAENCGFLNTNKILSNLIIFELCFAGSTILLGEIEWTDTWIIIAAGVIAAFVLYIIAEIFLKRSFIKILKSLYKFAAHMAVIAIVVVSCSTGLFGYSDYIPDRSKIKSAEISVPLSFNLISTDSKNLGWMSSDFIRVYEQYRHILLPVMSEKESIDKIIEINKTANETSKDDGTFCEIVICYNLENGKSSKRCHTLTSKEEIKALLGLFETKEYKDEIKKLFVDFATEDDIKDEFAEYGWVEGASYERLAFNYKYSEVLTRSTSLHEAKSLKLTEEQFNTLKDAVYKDLMALTAENYFTGNKKQLGVLSFGTDDEKISALQMSVENIDISTDIYYEEDMTMLDSPEYEIFDDEPIGEDIYLENIPTDIPQEEEIPADTRYLYEVNSPYNALGALDYFETYDVIITEDMTNTLNALNAMGFSDCFMSDFEIESVSFRECNTEKLFYYYSDNNTNYVYEFFAHPVTGDDFYFETNEVIENSYAENKITDKAKITELDSRMRLHSYTFNSGFYCLIKYTNGAYCVRYLSYEDAPDYVRNYNYSK